MLRPSDDLLARLRSTLGSAYEIEREIGAGNMSHVFVATETALSRRVVVKVLPPGVADGASVDRFRREIQLAATLQHPHIVPILQAGSADGLLYYTMPFVAGESVRELLRREVQLPVETAVRIAREVADALDYAHRHGVVHRDIKPDNILLEDGHAVVADFGIARALSRVVDTTTLTGTGIVIGTPSYMSPEQASADHELDSRTDIYSLGCVLYEMLAGEPPFTGPNVQAVIAKRLSSVAPPVEVVRPSVPPGIREALAKALRVNPADRFATAGEFARALATSERRTSTAVTFGLLRGAGARRTGVVVVAFAALVLAATALRTLGRGRADESPVSRDVVAVLPFRVAGADPALGYLREGMIDLLAAKLTGEGGPRAADPRSVVSAWRQTSGSESGDPTEAVAVRIAERLGAGQVLLGAIVGTPARFVINAALVSVRGERSRVEASVEGPPDSLPGMIDRLTAQLLAREAGEGERFVELTSTSLPALRFYLRGQAAYREGRYEEAVRHFEAALQRDTSFALAAVGLFSAAYWTPNDEPFERGKRTAWAQRSRLTERDRAYVTAWTGPRYPATASFAEMVGGWERAIELAPDRPEPWFELGDVYFHFGPLFGAQSPNRRAASGFQRALSLDSAFAAPLSHLVELAAIEGDTAELRRSSRLYLARDSAADVADYVRWRAALALRDERALSALRARSASLSTGSLRRMVGLGQVSGVGMDDVDRAAEVLRGRAVTPSEARLVRFELHNLALNRGRLRQVASAIESYREVEPYSGAALDLQLFDAVFDAGDSTAAGRAAGVVSRLAESGPVTSADARRAQDAHRCSAALWRTSRGDTTATRRDAALLEASARGDSAGVRGVEGATCAAALRVTLELARGSPSPAAEEGLERALARTGPATFGGAPIENIGRITLARSRLARGDTAAALVALRRRAYHHSGTTYLAPSLREEARIAALSGDRAGAERALRHFLVLRGNADPPLRTEAERLRVEVGRAAQ